MEEAVLDFMRPLMTSSWIFVLIFAIAFIDGFFPLVPAETSVIAAGATAASLHSPNVGMLIIVAAVAAFCGDHASYAIGRYGFGRVSSKLKPGTKRKKAFDWAHDSLLKRGGIVLVIARYIPGGRTAITITCGALRYPLRRFAFFEVIAASTWAVYSAMIGYIAGSYFENRPLLALGLGFVIAMSCAAIIELVRHILSKRAKNAVVAPDPAMLETAAESTTAQEKTSV